MSAKSGEKIYGVADKAWQVVVGCDPHMPCAPRCWARRTVARIVECQKPVSPERAEFFQIALTPDGKRWSGEVRLDEAHLTDPIRWRKPARVATGFHGDWARMSAHEMARVLAITSVAWQHNYMLLTKLPESILSQLQTEDFKSLVLAHGRGLSKWVKSWGFEWPIQNVSIGCSVMNQSEADKMREPMAAIAALGWATHVWYEPALSAVDWKGWEFLRGLIAGGESGKDARPSNEQWHRDTRDWCVANGIPFNFKQWGDWSPQTNEDAPYGEFHGIGGWVASCLCAEGTATMYRVGKTIAGRLLDGRTWDELPAFHSEVRA